MAGPRLTATGRVTRFSESYAARFVDRRLVDRRVVVLRVRRRVVLRLIGEGSAGT
jgi:hypothetical protein